MNDAYISECQKYRYSLTRIWDDSKDSIMFVMLNPSIADSEVNDRTITKCINFAKSWGYGGMYVCNLFSYRSTDPYELLNVSNPVGDENGRVIQEMAEKVNLIICGWGKDKIINKLFKDSSPYKELLFAKSKLHYLRINKPGNPSHLLYLPNNLTPIELSEHIDISE